MTDTLSPEQVEELRAEYRNLNYYTADDRTILSLIATLHQRTLERDRAIENFENLARDYTQLTKERDEAREAARALVERMDYVQHHPDYLAVWGLAVAHGLNYQGPQWGAEEDALRATLSQEVQT